MEIHPGDLLLREAFGGPRLGRERRRRIVDHLGDCARCRERLQELLRPERNKLAETIVQRVPGFTSDIDYDAVLDRSFRRFERLRETQARERAEAPGLFDRLLEHPPQRRTMILDNHPRFQSWALAELMLDRGLDQAYENARVSEYLATLAFRVAERLDPRKYGRPLLEDLRGRSWAHIANARRVRDDFAGAERAFDLAFAHLGRGTTDPVERATCLEFKSSLRRDQNRSEEAMRLLDRSRKILERLGDRHRLGRLLIHRQISLFDLGRTAEGIPLLQQAVQWIDARREPRLLLCTSHNLVNVLLLEGQTAEAQSLYAKVRFLYDEFPGRRLHSQRLWLEGNMAAGLGRYGEAETLLQAARNGYAAEGLAADAEDVARDLERVTLARRRRQSRDT